jgi:hypothetical protein
VYTLYLPKKHRHSRKKDIQHAKVARESAKGLSKLGGTENNLKNIRRRKIEN